MSDGNVVLPSPLALIRDVEIQVPWEPTILMVLRSALKLDHHILPWQHIHALTQSGHR